MKVEIITPEKSLFSGEALSVTVPSTQGPFTMLENHAPIVAILEKGKVVVETKGERKEFEIEGGFCEQHDNTVIICVEKLGVRSEELGVIRDDY